MALETHLYKSKVPDPIHEEIRLPSKVLEVANTPAFRRGQNIRMASNAPGSPYSLPLKVRGEVDASRSQHELGVYTNAVITTKHSDFRDQAGIIRGGALLHDIGTGPFSHLTDYFMKVVLKVGHEGYAEHIIKNDLELARAIKNAWGNEAIDSIPLIIRGEFKPWSDLIDGSIDLDNIDGIIRSLHNRLPNGLSLARYDPKELAGSFRLFGNELVMDLPSKDSLYGWEDARSLLYNTIYDVANMSSMAMGFRALWFALLHGRLDENFMRMVDNQALEYLLQANKKDPTRLILERIVQGQYFPRIVNDKFKASHLTPEQKDYMDNPENHALLADSISGALNVPAWKIAVFMGKNKGVKKIDLPRMVWESDEIEYHVPRTEDEYMLQVYGVKGFERRRNEMKTVVDSVLDRAKLTIKSERKQAA